ncbi:MAG TPA: hypothetical protein DHW82_05495 [Spirochaetia bacterium]|nr:hypothetical protein [Spirochaetia bacterium]
MKEKDKNLVEEKKKILLGLAVDFCDQNLDSDYKELVVKLIEKMSRKRTVPFLSGRIEIWAAASIYAIGQINFLFDKSSTPYQSSDDIANFFKTTKSSVSQKAKVIRDMFKMNYYDEEFSTKRMKQSNPFSKLMMVNGLIVPKDFFK